MASYLNSYPIVGEELTCPVCKKVFKATNETRYIRNGGHTCSWECFTAPPEKVQQQPNQIPPKEDPKVEQPKKLPQKKKSHKTAQSPNSEKQLKLSDCGKVELF